MLKNLGVDFSQGYFLENQQISQKEIYEIYNYNNIFLANMLIANNNIADTTQYQNLADRGNEALDNKTYSKSL